MLKGNGCGFNKSSFVIYRRACFKISSSVTVDNFYASTELAGFLIDKQTIIYHTMILNGKIIACRIPERRTLEEKKKKRDKVNFQR